jgi:MscS family membrane protein
MNGGKKLMKCNINICCFILFSVVIASIMLLISGPSLAQSTPPKLKDVIEGAPEKKEAEDQLEKELKKTGIPVDELDRGVPLTSVKGFFKATRERDYERAAEYLDLRNLPRGMDKNQGPQLARHLKIALDRTVWIDLDTLSTDPKGHSEDGLPSYRDRVCRIKTPEKEIDVLLQRVPRDDGSYIWKFSSVTVVQIPQLYKYFGYGYLERFFPASFFDLEILGIHVWLWVSLIILFIIAYLIAFVGTVLFTYFLSHTKLKPSDRFKRFIAGPIRFLLTLLLVRSGIDLITPTVALRALVQTYSFLIIVITWAVMGLFDFIFDRLAHRFRQDDQRAAALVLLPPLRNAAKIILILIAIIVWLDNIGFKVTTLLAGLGIGSIALALAAQKSIENLIGAVTLYTSKPVRVGDFCKFGETLGTVEEIGLRSTRIRSLDNTLISVPNAEFMNLHLNNFSKREKIWYHPKIRLRYETTPEQISLIIAEIKKLLTSHPKVIPDPARVRFTNFNTYSLDLDVFAYIDVTDYGKYLEIAEELNIKIMKIVAQAGSKLAIPSQTTYLESERGLDEELKHAAGSWGREQREKTPNGESQT